MIAFLIDLLREYEMWLAAFTIVTAGSLAFYVAIIRQRTHVRRLAVLDRADQLVDDTLGALERLLRDRQTPPLVKALAFSATSVMGDRRFANCIERHGRGQQARAARDPEADQLLEDLRPALEQLAARRRRDLLDDMETVMENCRLVSLLRWPETEALGLAKLQRARPARRAEPEIEEIHNIEVWSGEIYSAAPQMHPCLQQLEPA